MYVVVVILYADVMTKSINEAVSETDRRRKIQAEYNAKHGITPQTAMSSAEMSLSNEIKDGSLEMLTVADRPFDILKDPKDQQRLIAGLKKDMFDAAAKKEFERAAEIRDAYK